MRIIGGYARGIPLHAGDNPATRPTTDRLKETLFNLLGPLQDLKVIDAFAGSGALGLECLSRGAASCTFIESDRRTLQVLQRNLDAVCRSIKGAGQTPGHAVSMAKDATTPLPLLDGGFDLILCDPPYELTAQDLEGRWTQNLVPALRDGGRLVVEVELRTRPAVPPGLHLLQRRDFPSTSFIFYTRTP